MYMSKYDKKKDIYIFKNGFKVVFINNRSTNKDIFYCYLYVLTGTLQENKKTLEYQHFLEHMNAFFTSEKYPNGKENMKLI